MFCNLSEPAATGYRINFSQKLNKFITTCAGLPERNVEDDKRSKDAKKRKAKTILIFSHLRIRYGFRGVRFAAWSESLWKSSVSGNSDFLMTRGFISEVLLM